MATVNMSFVGGGKLHFDGRFIGNAPTFNLSFASDTITLPDSTNPGGGLYNSIERISDVAFDFEFSDYNAPNLAFSLFGSYAAVTGGPVTDESLAVPATLDNDTLIKTAKTIDTADIAGTVTLGTDPAATLYVLNTDYTVSAAGITIINTADGGNIPVSAPLLVNYTALAVDLVQALVNSGQEYNILLDGFNDAQSGAPVVVNIFKGKPSPAAGMPFISTDFASNAVTGSIVKDTTVVGVGLSQYCTIVVAEPT